MLAAMKIFRCEHCDNLLFFENTRCVACGRETGFSPDDFRMHPVELGSDWRPCANHGVHGVCNWLLPADSPETLCASCVLTTVIPDLGETDNRDRWGRLEAAKRRLVYTLRSLSLPLVARRHDPVNGLEFHFKSDEGMPPGQVVLTGHDDGVITLNIAEADDAERERRRVQLHEPYRTLLGHFRHESGHYYWDRLIRDDPGRLARFRELFGDETRDYGEALQAHYESGIRPGWQDGYISAYATAHPWEDWAESWAHYLHMVDGLETAAACGVRLQPDRADEPSLHERPAFTAGGGFARMQADWAALTYAMNNLNRSMGLNDAYPFVLSAPALRKLEFIHEVVTAH